MSEPTITPADVLSRLEYVIDPELGVDIVNLGLVYDVQVLEGGRVAVTMTLTTQNCPLTFSMPAAVERAVRSLPGVTDVAVELIWSPPWHPSMMSPLARARLGYRPESE